MLSEETCEACRADALPVTVEALPGLLKQIPDWLQVSVNGTDRLVRAYRTVNFLDAQAFANTIGDMAEQVGHHPQIIIEWGRVEVSWWTHKINGLHRNDFILAARTDEAWQARS